MAPVLKVEETETAGEVRGESAFAGSGRTVDGDDGPLTFGFDLRCVPAAAIPLLFSEGNPPPPLLPRRKSFAFMHMRAIIPSKFVFIKGLQLKTSI